MFTFVFYFPLILVHLSGRVPSLVSPTRHPDFSVFNNCVQTVAVLYVVIFISFFFIDSLSLYFFPYRILPFFSIFIFAILLPSLSCTLVLSSFLRRFILHTLILNWFSFSFANISQFTLHNKQYKSVSLYSCYYNMITSFSPHFIVTSTCSILKFFSTNIFLFSILVLFFHFKIN